MEIIFHARRWSAAACKVAVVLTITAAVQVTGQPSAATSLGSAVVSAPSTPAAQDPLVATADRLAAALLRSGKAPGLAVAVVRNDQVILTRGYGRRTLSTPGAVDDKTLFGVGGFTKGATAAALATLVDEGRLKWDDPVIKYLPSFRLSDRWVSEHVTVRDLALMRLGLPRADQMLNSSRSPAEVFARAAEWPALEFRSSYGVSSNFAYFVAGEVLAAVSKQSWEDFVRQRLLTPLGMTTTTTRLDAVLASGNLARPYTFRKEAISELEPHSFENMPASAGLFSNAADLGAWLRFQLGRGEFEGRRIISDELMKEMHTPLVISSVGGFRGFFNRYASVIGFGLGWHISDYRGRTIVENGGVFGGYTQFMFMSPHDRLGVAILTNMSPAEPVWDSIQDMKFGLLDFAIGPVAAAVRKAP